jgi:Ca-activated chloride channel homolog
VRTLGIAAAAVLQLASPASPQAPPSPAVPVFPIDLDVVNVTVTVRDDQDQLVADLGPEDFVLREDGEEQPIQVFGRAMEPGQDETLALDLGMLLDTSQSMLKELKLSQVAAIRFLDAIPRARELITIFFDQDIRISRYTSENQQGLFARIQEAQGGGNTALYDAITVYLSRVQGSPGRKVLVVFSDGEDSISEVGMSEVLELIRSCPVTIYPIAFSGGFVPGSQRALKARSFLLRVAELSGGQVFTPMSYQSLSEIYDKILDELRSQYVLGFVSSNGDHDGRFRKLEVEVRHRGYKVRHRRGYYAPPS